MNYLNKIFFKFFDFVLSIFEGLRSKKVQIIQEKEDTLKNIVKYRNFPLSQEFQQTIDEIPVSFFDCEKVLDALKVFEYSREVNDGNEKDKFGVLLRAMFQELKKDKNMDVTYLLRSMDFNTK